MAPRATQRGMLLAEALVAILVFSAGVLGTVGLQARALRHIDNAHVRGEAARLAGALIARMWADDPATLVERYESTRGGAGFRDFSAMALRLPGAALPGNAPEVRVAPGPSAASRAVTITLRWQAPGEPQAHRHAATAIIGRN